MPLLKNILRGLKYYGLKIIHFLDVGTRLINMTRNKYKVIFYKDIKLTFSVPNWLCRYRVDTFASKEPETLEWIDRFPEESVFWDLGANIGLYSIYAAKKRKCRVFSFEPSIFNLESLARNISLNNLTTLVCLIPLAVGNKTEIGLLHMSSTEWGGALSTFGKTYGYDGKELNQIFEYSILSVSLDDAVTKLGLPSPHYLKIDVDGIEHLILSGGLSVLRSVRSVLIEISTGFQEQAMLSKKHLEEAGLTIIESHLDELSNRDSSSITGTVNQIWGRI